MSCRSGNISKCSELQAQWVLAMVVLFMYLSSIVFCIRRIARIDLVMTACEITGQMERQMEYFEGFSRQVSAVERMNVLVKQLASDLKADWADVAIYNERFAGNAADKAMANRAISSLILACTGKDPCDMPVTGKMA